MLEGRDGVLENARSGVRVPTHEVVVFALDSVAKLFAERDVVGRTYEVDVRSYEVQGTPRFHLALA
jgi:hypothetical protein